MSYSQAWPYKSTPGGKGQKGAEHRLAVSRRVEILAGVPLFEGLSKRQLTSIARAVSVAHFDGGSTIVLEGSRASFCCVLVEGSAEAVKGDKVIARFGPGDLFGEIAMIDPGPRTATVRAVTEVTAIQIPHSGFVEVATADPQILMRMLKVLAHRMRKTDESLD